MRSAILTERARNMRQEMAGPEMQLWLQLRAGRFEGIKFRRQKVIGKYIADFAANAPRLVIELDGDTHAGREDYDDWRTNELQAAGYTVIRFANRDVTSNMDGVLTKLAEIVRELRQTPPLPTLSPEGERANMCEMPTISLSAEGDRPAAHEKPNISLSPSGERVGERGKE
ncbi:MAG: DUF559 domain-containing protein [Blastomonas sp.]